ncbi:hypothetical protein ABW20_dc0100162 [Dactylellina cionopaga]|nr:hypothetical protein ABW20_dc0100162 [Dactylellina cionopaga]
MGGHIVVLPLDPQSAASVLPDPRLDWDDLVKVVWISPNAPTESQLKPFLQVRREVVRQALVGLKRDNPLYKDIHIDHGELNRWDSEFIPERVFKSIVHVPDTSQERAEREGYANRSCYDDGDADEATEDIETPDGIDTNAAFSGSVLQDVNQVLGTSTSAVVARLEETMFPDVPQDNEYRGHTQYKNGSKVKNISTHDDFLTGTFPFLFWNGKGGHKLERRTKVVLLDWIRFYLEFHSRRWSRHPDFIYLAFSVYILQENSLRSYIATQKKHWPRVQEQLSELSKEDFEQAGEECRRDGKVGTPKVISVMSKILSVGWNLPMSSAVRFEMRKRAFSMIIRYGSPALWLTVNPYDLSNPIAYTIAGYGPRSEFGAGFSWSNEFARRCAAITKDPVASAEFFHTIIAAFFETMVMPLEEENGNGIFGPCDAYFGATETNGRGALHIHCLIWLKGSISPSELKERLRSDSSFSERIIAYLERISRTDASRLAKLRKRSEVLTDTPFNTDGDMVQQGRETAYYTNTHEHMPSCYKHSAGQKGCRFSYPRDAVAESHVDSDGVVHLKRSERDKNVNAWNPPTAVALRCNHDVSYLATKLKAHAMIYYITNYATKQQKPFYHSYAITAALMDAQKSRWDALVESTDGEARKRASRSLIMKLFNKLSVLREISGSERAASVLLMLLLTSG